MRREFLGGFRKRKLERKKKAQEQLQQRLKEERKIIKQNVNNTSLRKCITFILPWGEHINLCIFTGTRKL